MINNYTQQSAHNLIKSIIPAHKWSDCMRLHAHGATLKLSMLVCGMQMIHEGTCFNVAKWNVKLLHSGRVEEHNFTN